MISKSDNFSILPLQEGHSEKDAFKILAHNKSTVALKILSSMLHKAWPPELNNANQLNEEIEDEILLNHLLTWQAWPGFLKIFGKKFLDHHTID